MSGSTSIGNDQRKGSKPTDAPPDDKSTLLPGNEVLPGTVVTDESPCSHCGGSGKLPDGSECKVCQGDGERVMGAGSA